jgi:cyclophilin family peptidyl-prolyl cis-trans isomerase
MWKKKRDKSRSAGTLDRPAAPESLFESLEPRAMLYLGPMINSPPPVSMLESSADTVIRVLTNFGPIDLELFDSTAPNTVNNFKANYINSGKIDETFFHFLGNGTLRAGGYKFTDGVGLSTIATVAPVANEFSRPNVSGTLAMWKPDGQPNGATSQFFINLQDNPTLNTTNGGYTVFGKVVQGWSVVQTIAALLAPDLDQALTGSNPNPGTFDKVPVTGAFNGTPTEATLVRVIDVDAMKPIANGRYYENQYIYPEGFRSATTTERIDLVNLETDFYNAYQIIVHYESGDRDAVIATGALSPGKRLSLKINDANLPNYNLVRSNVGYSIEVRSTRAMAVSFNHRDFNVQLGESFVMTPRYAEGAFRNWNFGGAEKGASFRNFLVWQGLKDVQTTVNVGIFPAGGSPKFFAFQLKPFRRGGVAIQDLATIPDGQFSIQVSASGPIIAALSSYKLGGGGNPSDGGTSQGGINQGGYIGYLASASIPTGGESHIDVLYTAGSPSAITVAFTFILNDGTQLTGNPVLLTAASRRARRDISQMGVALPIDTNFSVRYAVTNNAAPVTVNYTSQAAGDVMTTVFQVATTGTVAFADGYTDPTLAPSGQQETYSIFNPYREAANVSFFYQYFFQFSDGTSILSPLSSLLPWRRADMHPRDIPDVLAKINSNAAFRFYSVKLITAQFGVPVPTGGVIAQMTRTHNTWGQTVTSTPSLDSRLPVLFMNNPEFG